METAILTFEQGRLDRIRWPGMAGQDGWIEVAGKRLLDSGQGWLDRGEWKG